MTNPSGFGVPALNIDRFAQIVDESLGIQLPESKRVMVVSRLAKRVRELGLHDVDEYFQRLGDEVFLRQEISVLPDLITTNKTDFFREPAHFDVLRSVVIPDFAKRKEAWSTDPLRVWSAGCSTGEEPYTLSMVLGELERHEMPQRNRFKIMATDVSADVLEEALRAVYSESRIAGIPNELRSKVLLRSKSKRAGTYRVSQEVRSRVTFGRLNFKNADFGLRQPMHVIFCRNVMIYFSRDFREQLIQRFCRALVPGGYLFIGHSETFHGVKAPLKQIAPAVAKRI